MAGGASDIVLVSDDDEGFARRSPEGLAATALQQDNGHTHRGGDVHGAGVDGDGGVASGKLLCPCADVDAFAHFRRVSGAGGHGVEEVAAVRHLTGSAERNGA